VIRFGLVLVLVLAGCSKSQPAPSEAPVAAAHPPATSKDPAAARRAIAAGAVVLDVRTVDEFAEDHLPGAINVPVQELGSRLGEVDRLVASHKDTPIVVYCASGGRAGKAKTALEAEGYTRVVNGGGLDDLR